MLPRLHTMEVEREFLSPHGFLTENSKGRKIYEAPCDFRTEFQRDRDRIIHCNAFRRLKHKTQVFLKPVSDHYRTRLTHTLEVSQIARTISCGLRLNENLTEAIALGHDLGHTPFGHDGEKALRQLYPDGFKHNQQSVRVVEIIEKDGKGLNLTAEVIDGILNHTGKFPSTNEGMVVRLSDRIAYINHDIEDAIRGGIIENGDLPKEPIKLLGKTKSQRITTLVTSIINNGDKEIKMAPEIQEASEELRTFMFKNVYEAKPLASEKNKVFFLLEYLYNHFKNNIEEMPPLYIDFATKYGEERAVCDFISGMSDVYAINLFNNICMPKGWNR